jgi:hypothetical protein
MLGHPLRNPLRTAFSSVEIFGLHNAWCANLTALARVRTEWVNDAISTIGMLVLLSTRWNSGGGCGARSIQGPDRGRTVCSGAAHTEFGMGRIHKSVFGSLRPLKITLPLYTTLNFLSSNITVQPALHRGRIPMRDATVSEGTMCPVNVLGRPRMWLSHTCVDFIRVPSGKLIVRGFTAMHLLATSAPSIVKMDVAPVSAISRFGAIVIVLILHGDGWN